MPIEDRRSTINDAVTQEDPELSWIESPDMFERGYRSLNEIARLFGVVQAGPNGLSGWNLDTVRSVELRESVTAARMAIRAVCELDGDSELVSALEGVVEQLSDLLGTERLRAAPQPMHRQSSIQLPLSS